MKHEILLSAALVAAAAGTAHAQVTRTAPPPAPPAAPATGTFNNGFNNGFNRFATTPSVGVANPSGFVNPFTGFPVDPATGLAVNPGITQVPPFAGFTSGFDPNTLLNGGPVANSGSFFPGFTPGLGLGSYYGYGGYPGYGYGAYNLTPNQSLGAPLPRFNGARVPVLGVNVPPTAIPRGPRARVTQLSPTATQRLADTPNGVVSSGAAATPGMTMARVYSAPRDFATVQQVDNLMRADRPLHEGRVVSVGATGAQVAYGLNNSMRTDSFPVDEVFFFRANGDLVTMAQNPEMVRVGSKVLIAEPRNNTPQFSVAGSRQSYTGGARLTHASYKVTRKSAKKHVVKRHTAKRAVKHHK